MDSGRKQRFPIRLLFPGTYSLYRRARRLFVAERATLGFLDTYSTQLGDCVESLDPEKRFELVLQCFGQFPQEIRRDPDVMEAMGVLDSREQWTSDKIHEIGEKADRTFGLSVDAGEMGNEDECTRLDRVSSILSAVWFAMKERPMSAQCADKCLYYMSEVLTEEFVGRLLSQFIGQKKIKRRGPLIDRGAGRE